MNSFINSNNYYVLYDSLDNIICLFESYEEFNKICPMKLKEFVRKFKNSSDYHINVVINKKTYKLFIFEN